MAHKDIAHLLTIKNKFDSLSIDEKEAGVIRLGALTFKKGNELEEVHDLLLFLIEHAHSPAFRLKCEKALKKVCSSFANLSIREKESITESGISGTTVVATFSFAWMEWMIKAYPRNIVFDSFGASDKVVEETMGALLPKAEREYYFSSDEINFEAWYAAFGGNMDLLFFVMHCLEQSNVSEERKSELYSRLELFVKIDLSRPELSRTYTRGLARPVYYHSLSLLRQVDAEAIMQETLSPDESLSLHERIALVEVKKRHLAALFRETDPATYADVNDVKLFEMGRGMEIALYGLRDGHRLDWESYIGFMAFKNNIPYAYGGAWMFGPSARIGTNIFSPFRGGESAWFFCQLMRLYFQLFKVHAFIAEPYQIGKDNPEGIESGAFWFYYRLGYRPAEKDLKVIAEKEFNKIAANRAYRTPKKILEQLAECHLIRFSKNEKSIQVPDQRMLSRAVSIHINKHWKGDRSAALRWVKYELPVLLDIDSMQSWSESEVNSFYRLGLYLCVISDWGKWKKEDKEQVVALLKMKGSGIDSDFAVALSSCSRLINKFSQIK